MDKNQNDEELNPNSQDIDEESPENIFSKIKVVKNRVLKLSRNVDESKEKVDTDSKAVAANRQKSEEDAKIISAKRETAEEAVEKIEKNKSLIQTQVEEIGTLLQQARDDQKTTAALAGKATSLEESLTQRETKLTELKTDFDEIIKKSTKDYNVLFQTVEGLLPGATSAGLASSFEKRKNEFRRSKELWSMWFGLSLVSLFAVAAFDLSGIVDFQAIKAWPDMSLYLVKKLPFAIPIIWAAIFTGRHHWLASRLEEEYAYKQAISSSFEGYKKQMQDISSENEQSTALATLCDNVLKTLAVPPGTIYDKKQKDITPLNAIADASKNLVTELPVTKE